jgi:hypothetical protein
LRYWDTGVGNRERGSCGQSPEHTASKRNISKIDSDLGITVWNEMDYHSDMHRNLMSNSQNFDTSSLCSADFIIIHCLLFSDQISCITLLHLRGAAVCRNPAIIRREWKEWEICFAVLLALICYLQSAIFTVNNSFSCFKNKFSWFVTLSSYFSKSTSTSDSATLQLFTISWELVLYDTHIYS